MKKNRFTHLSSTYQVGYGRPPEAHRFKPGKSGNPKGRKKARLDSIENIMRDELMRIVTVTENGKPTRLPFGQLLARQFLAQAAKGNVKALTGAISPDGDAAAD